MLETVFLFAMLAIVYLVQGWVLSILWRWFIVPTFNLPELSIPLAIGVAIVVGFLTRSYDDAVQVERSKFDRYGRLFVRTTIFPFFTLLIAWIVYQFV